MTDTRPLLDDMFKKYEEPIPTRSIFLNYILESVDLANKTDAEYIAAAIEFDRMKMKGQIGYLLPIEVIICKTNTIDVLAVLTVIDRSVPLKQKGIKQ